MWRVKGWGRRPTRSNTFTFTGNGRDALVATLSLTRRSSCCLFSPLSPLSPPLSPRSNVLRVKELYQYPKPDGGANDETDVFSREPFIIRFHSPTTRTMKHHETCTRKYEKIIDNLYNNRPTVCIFNTACHQEIRETSKVSIFNGLTSFEFILKFSNHHVNNARVTLTQPDAGALLSANN